MGNEFSNTIAAKLIMMDDPESAGNELFEIAERCLEEGKDIEIIIAEIFDEISKFDLVYAMNLTGVYAERVSDKYGENHLI